MRIIINLLIALTLLSCTTQKRAQWHLRRAHSIYPAITKSDTIRDTTILEGAVKDTTFNYYQKDTVIMREGKLVMKYFYNTHDSTVYLKGECLPDTVYQTTVINNTTIEDKKTFWDKIQDSAYNPFLWIILLILLYIILKK